MKFQRSKAHGLAVLALDRECAEWLSVGKDGQERYGVSSVVGTGVQALADAALAAVRESGTSPGRCVLALGQGLARQRLVALPVLSRRDTRAALRRKAAGMCECDVDGVAFSATCFDEAAAGSNDAKGPRVDARWLVVAIPRDEARELRIALAKLGFKIARTVSSQLSTLARAQSLRADPTQACIAVSALRRSASVALIHGATLVNENLLDGDMRTQPALAMSLVQEIKSFDAAWRKANRGGAVGQVVLIGLPRDRSVPFKAAVNAALPSATVILADATEARDGDTTIDRGRLEALDACRETGGLQSDLTLPIPLQPKSVALVLVAIFAALSTIATIVYRPARRAEIEELAAVAASNARTAGLEELRRANTEAAAALKQLDELTERNTAVLEHGWKLRAVATEVLSAFGRDAALVGLELGEIEKGEMEMAGVASSDPASAMVGVDRIVKALEASDRFEGVVAAPSGTVPTGSQPIAFVIKTNLKEER